MTTIGFDADSFTFHRQGCKHGREEMYIVGDATTHEEAMNLEWMQILIKETYEGDTSIIWFQPCTGIKNPAGYTKPDFSGIDPVYASAPRRIVSA